MKEAIRQRAFELGFDGCRFAPGAPPARGEGFQRWLEQGRHGRMEYLARNAAKRKDPALVLPGVRTLICLAAAYPAEAVGPGSGREPGPGPTGIVARYARGEDYHETLRAPLKALAEFVEQAGGAGTRALWYVDTGPVLEREHAERAGIGFVGKHTNLISRTLGNWVLLAEILTTVDLEPDAPERNRCGRCERCLDACPTRAITAPFELDARRCISYLTIELRGSIPVEFREAVGARIFGCDDCLAVCPWNRFAREGRLMRAAFRADLGAPKLGDLLELDEVGFQRRFAGTPLLRAKRTGLMRNVCVALGNVGDASALPRLRELSAGPDGVVAEHAAWAVGRIEARGGLGAAAVSQAPPSP